MSFRFFRRVKILPGVQLNFSRSGVSTSFGPRGAKLTVGKHGTRGTLGIPGTGLYYTKLLSRKRGSGRRRRGRTAANRYQDDPLTLDFFARLRATPEERALIDGLKDHAAGDMEAAYQHLKRAIHLPDGAFLAGIVAFQMGKINESLEHLRLASTNAKTLGKVFARYGIAATVELQITEEITARIGPDARGVTFALAEAHQAHGDPHSAVIYLQRLHLLTPDDIVVRLSLSELLLDVAGDDQHRLNRVVDLAAGLENESEVHAALLMYKGKALRMLGLPAAARHTLTIALRRKKDRPLDLLHAIRYERALAYQEAGRRRNARDDLERIYSEDPSYEDVAVRLREGGDSVDSDLLNEITIL